MVSLLGVSAWAGPPSVTCADCSLRGEDSGGGEGPVFTALSEKAIQEQYAELRRNYVESGKCHLYSNYSTLEQKAFFAWLLNYELIALGGRNTNLTRDQALENIGYYLGWSESTLNRWKRDSRSVMELRAGLLREIDHGAANAEFRKKMEPRVKWHFDRLGVRDCGDFVSYEVFAEAMRSRGRNLSKIPEGRRHVLTILDRSQAISDRRMIVIDLKKNQVLLHTISSFGDGKVGGGVLNESKSCSNRGGTGLSPKGPAMTTRIGRAGNGGFRGDGVFLDIPSAGDGAGSWSGSRGLAIHAMSAYQALNLKGEQGTVARNYEKLVQGTADKQSLAKAMDGFLYNPVSPSEVRVPATDGCVGVPDDMMEQVKTILSGGEFVYFHCPG